MPMPIKKAVFPVAGLGTRFLPATKANPKEMLPIVDKPLIQYAVEEAISAGITELIFVTSHSKRSIEDHFDSNYELESRLEKNQRHDLLTMVQNMPIACSQTKLKPGISLIPGLKTCGVDIKNFLKSSTKGRHFFTHA